jgi:hypothetical protein
MDGVEKETQKPFEATHGRDNNPNMKPTTVNDYMSRPVRGDNGSKPVSPDNSNSRPGNSGKPVYNSRPSDNNSQKPVDSRPNSRGDNYEMKNKPVEQPTFEQRPQQKPSQQEKPVQRPSYEQKPRDNNQYQSPSTPPRNNNSSGGSRSGNSSPAPTQGPRKR